MHFACSRSIMTFEHIVWFDLMCFLIEHGYAYSQIIDGQKLEQYFDLIGSFEIRK